jgi:hypothetical protein
MRDSAAYVAKIVQHYQTVWQAKGTSRRWVPGRVWELPDEFSILEFPPSQRRRMWTYATICMSQPDDIEKLELHMFARDREDGIIELLTATAHYHCTGNKLDLGHTVNFGRPWVGGSCCDHGMISLPYLDGPCLEQYNPGGKDCVRFLWLIPITPRELEYKKNNGMGALETIFEQKKFDYLDPLRESVV